MSFCGAKELDVVIAHDTNQTNHVVIGNVFDIPCSDIDPTTMHSWKKMVAEARFIAICKHGLNKVGSLKLNDSLLLLLLLLLLSRHNAIIVLRSLSFKLVQFISSAILFSSGRAFIH